jgi:hypothetical protein
MATYDENGHLVDESPGLGQAQTSDNYSLGAAIYEFLNPSAVQAEAAAMGNPEPTLSDVWSAAAQTAAGAAVEQRQAIVAGVSTAATATVNLVKIALIVAALWGVAELLKQAPHGHG